MTTRQLVHQAPGQPVGDDFTRIHGIGPGIAARLNGAGILRFTQLASLSAEEIVAATGSLIGLTVDRVEQQDWAGQARELSETEFEPLIDESGGHLHYATFTVELLLDEENRVRRTRLVNVRAGDENVWVGWDADRLVQFFTGQAGLRAEPPAPAQVETSPAAEFLQETQAPGLPDKPPAPETIISAVEEAPAAEKAQPLDLVEIDRLAALHPQTGLHDRALPCDQPFTLTMTLGVAQTGLSKGTPLRCKALAAAKDLSSGARLILAEWDEVCALSEKIEINYNHLGLPKGIYRMEAAVTLYPEEEPFPGSQQFAAFREGELLQVF
ncbi:MAG TPA: hypothetical protein VIO36_10680 [Anaerolineaceae bacterium]